MFNDFYYCDIIIDFITVFLSRGEEVVARLDLTHYRKSYNTNLCCKSMSKQTKNLTNFELI